ncbi:YaaR family protein [uncultured Treponema sp.]|jgi:hypothetical protein|uniref:YaaR family protein n=1 Tax=uncultured Treponema sp. TaxID=162155 RepID=UPI0025EF0327|nr:YaaR family protein [uncultured Treponema sp.]
MADIQSVNTQLSSQSLYFAATQAASQQQAQQAKKAEKKEKSAFASAFEKRKAEANLVSEGLPPELAGMSEEEAIVFLKDAMDMAGDELKARQDLASMEKYRRKVSQFMKYVAKNNFEIISKKRFGRNRKGRPVDPYIQVQVIDQKLNQLASEMLILHGANLNLLAKVEEIQGLIIDLMAE